MPPILRPPNRLEILGFPAFAMSWYGDPTNNNSDDDNGTSIVAYSGGGGSARTGVGNKVGVVINDQAEPRILSTGTAVGIAIHIYAVPPSNNKKSQKQIWMLLSLEHKVQRYRLPDCTLQGTLQMSSSGGSGCNCMAVNALADRLALGCEDGSVKVYALLHPTSDDNDQSTSSSLFTSRDPLFVGRQHENAVCAVNFAPRGDRLLSCAKDGTACVWKVSNGAFLTRVHCKVTDPTTTTTTAKQQRPTQVMVRGCAFGDLQGNLFYTVASARRGKAFLSRWAIREGPKRDSARASNEQETPTLQYQCQDRLAVSDFPISSMALSQDGELLVLGGVDGNATLWSTSQWKPLKVFKEIHGLPLTCVAPRPYFSMPLQGEDDGVVVHARTASADGTLACLTLQKRVPKTAASTGGGGLGMCYWMMQMLHYTMMLLLAVWIGSLIVREAANTCEISSLFALGEWLGARRCLMDDFLIAPASRPGISVPPF